jgi:hypothetical protein
MDVLAELFATNRVIVLSVYGQVFFVLGLAIALQSLKRSALALARPLPWLAAFGIVHGFHEWGYLFVPIQSGYLPLAATEALLVLQLLIKGVSFALLLQFGVELLAVTTRLPILGRLRLLPAAALLAWGGATLVVSAAVAGFEPDTGPWLQEGRIDVALAAVGAPLAVGDVLAARHPGCGAGGLGAGAQCRDGRPAGPLAGRDRAAGRGRCVRRLRRGGRPGRHARPLPARRAPERDHRAGGSRHPDRGNALGDRSSDRGGHHAGPRPVRAGDRSSPG